ncbi:hypothetical protein IV38_GL001529 [Lactobacillus selangorensis]|uniref:Cell surface hydrolase n=1 Tax=Lactobacillus selangorensis TaxID=81857 RepID=A0A0R2FHH3_9LACO|nr:alpha/beta hydrolase [Lactobacillus selangorensis]KRN28079.1 hypothetical protein IV38_GL001529 [Lactobacillus selangorensis]KRN31043.1 hypothetical protein IV40_GL001686 [Lactobacillus selangorensis]
MKKQTKIIGFILVALVLIGGGFGVYNHSAHSSVAKQYTQTHIPTLFFHGWGSSYHAEEHMVAAAKKAQVTNGVIRAEVSKKGQVTLVGKLPRKAVNPIVMVDFKNPRQINYHTTGKWVENVLTALQKQYGFTQYNTVSHSAGNEAVMYYLAEIAPTHKKLPQLHKEVNIAGHFDGIRGIDAIKGNSVDKNGKPQEMIKTYRDLLSLRTTFPKNAEVLNIYGNIGDHSDGTVQNDSSKSLQYLVGNRAKSYRNLEIDGKQAQHSKLHSNAQVDKALINFLWAK